MARPAAGSEMSIDELRARRSRAISGNGLDHGLLARGEADECVRRCGFAVLRCRRGSACGCARFAYAPVCVSVNARRKARPKGWPQPATHSRGTHFLAVWHNDELFARLRTSRATYRAKLHSEKSSSIGHNRQQ